MQNEAIHINWLIKSHWSCWWAKKRIGVILIQTFRHATNLVFDTCPVYTWSLLISFFAENDLFTLNLFFIDFHMDCSKSMAGCPARPFSDHFCWKCCTGLLIWEPVSRVWVSSGIDSAWFFTFSDTPSHTLTHFVTLWLNYWQIISD